MNEGVLIQELGGGGQQAGGRVALGGAWAHYEPPPGLLEMRVDGGNPRSGDRLRVEV